MMVGSCFNWSFRHIINSVSKTGLPPFYDENVNTMYQRILRDPLLFPPDMSSEAKSVMTALLQRDPARRLGANGGEEIKRHPFFAKYIDWNRYVLIQHYLQVDFAELRCSRRRLLAKKIQPPFKPSVVSHFRGTILVRGMTNNHCYTSGICPRCR